MCCENRAVSRTLAVEQLARVLYETMEGLDPAWMGCLNGMRYRLGKGNSTPIVSPRFSLAGGSFKLRPTMT